MKRWLKIYALFLIFSVSCTGDPGDFSGYNGNQGDPVDYTFVISVPELTEVNTRSLADNEYAIREVEIIVFHDDAYNRIATGRDLVKTSTGYRFTASLVPHTGPVSLYFIANISATLHENFSRIEEYPGIVTPTVAKSQAYVRFRNFVSRRDVFPMSGEIKLTSLNEQTAIPTVNMVRAFARLDIVAHENVSNRFRLSKARVRNISSHFQIAPDDGNFLFDGNGNYTSVTTPSIPVIPVGEDDLKLWSDEYAATGNRITNFYVPECEAGSSEPTCVVIEGYYRDSATPSYYRVDLGPKGSPGEVIRNRKYTLTITSVTGPGHSSADDAMLAPSDDINTYIIWEEDGSKTIYDKDGNKLSVSGRTFSLHFAKAAMDVVDVDSSLPSAYTLEWADDNGDPQGATPIGYGQSMEDTDFRVKISADGKQLFVTALRENTGSMHKIRRLLGRTGQLLFTMTIDQGIRDTRPYLKIYNPVGIVGDLGDEIMEETQREPTGGPGYDVLQKLLKNESHFGMRGTIPFDGFRIAGVNYELPISSYLVKHYDIIYIGGTADTTVDATSAGHIKKWLEDTSERQKVLVTFTCNQTLLRELGITTKQWYPLTYALSPQAPEIFTDGPFGKVTAVPTPAAAVPMQYIDPADNPHITPIMVSDMGAPYGEGIYIGVDMEKKIVFFADHYFFTPFNAGKMTGGGVITTDMDRLVANIWAWIAETALGDMYDPELPRQ